MIKWNCKQKKKHCDMTWQNKQVKTRNFQLVLAHRMAENNQNKNTKWKIDPSENSLIFLQLENAPKSEYLKRQKT